MASVAIIDVIGLTYDGNTLSKRGLGGSESAVILMSRELAALGFDVTVFNNCIDREAEPGVYDGVTYIDLSKLHIFNDYEFDVVISSRTVFPFLKEQDYNQFLGRFPVNLFKNIKANAKHKVVWMHDTFLQGDHLLEKMMVDGDIDDVFTLSDFHTSYVTTCNHGAKRMLEVMKRKVFMTRNGATLYPGEVNISAKDRDLFVYNASVTKGMIPLVNNVWPLVKAKIPSAKLIVIGGYYRFRENAEPDEQEKTWREMVADAKYADMGIEFTGIIKQSEIADILKKASFMLYPPAFPETFGISTLESLLYNTPLITGRFGALEETAIEQASYFVDYPATPNVLYPHINEQAQAINFANVAIHAWQDAYLHQQKMYYCNIVKGIHGWDSVAMQWKQHLYKKLGLYLSVDEYRAVSQINARVREVFGRRFSNPEEVYVPRNSVQQRIVVVSPTYNAEQYIEKCIESVATQDYDNWKMIVVDDCSPDNTAAVAANAAAKFDAGRIEVYKNPTNQGAVYNHIATIRSMCEPDDIVMLIDGDDALINNNQLFHFYNNLYDGSTEFSYGSMWSMVDNIPLVAQPYPESVKQNRAYRQHRFNWNMPYTHLRTFKAGLLDGVDDSNFQDDDGNWFKAGGDGATFYTLIERADPAKIKVVSDIVYLYNDINPINDYKVNGDEQTKTANAILAKKPAAKASASGAKAMYSVVMPTMWRATELTERMLTELTQYPLVDEIIIIDNDTSKTPDWDVLKHEKIVMMPQKSNIYVNPAWNLGVKFARNQLVAIINDDIVFDTDVFVKIRAKLLFEGTGVMGIIAGEEQFNQPLTTDGSINMKEWKKGDHIHGFGQAMFIRRDHWVPITDGMLIYFGDDHIFHTQLMAGRKNYMIYNIRHETPCAQTTKDTSITGNIFAADKKIFDPWFWANPLKKPEVQVEQPVVEQPVIEQKVVKPLKTILIAIPTNKYIEPETMKSIYDLEVPEGYKTHFQYFFGYQIDQIRNLIADWASRYDYLLSVDSDISFAPDTLKKMIAADKDMVSGLYIQRKPGYHILELYRGGRNVPYDSIRGLGIVEVDGCGFGCVLVKSEVIRAIGYPQFVYRSAIDHKNTLSEDNYFCMKAKEKGFRIFADTSILCGHHGANVFTVDNNPPKSGVERLRELNNQRLLPVQSIEYMNALKNQGVTPKVAYDIGACVLHWTNEAKRIWKDTQYICFEAMPESEPIFVENGVQYNIGVLSNEDNKELTFFQNTNHPGGNSYYRENVEVNPAAAEYFNDGTARKVKAMTLDTIVKTRKFPLPDFVKMDVQGAEMDVLKGAQETLKTVNHLILELQKIEYNKGAPLREEVIAYVESLGFKLMNNGPFCDNGVDGDYHFIRM